MILTKGSHLSGSASSGKIASTGHSGSQAPQSMHSSGSMISIRSNSWMQSTGQTSTHERSLMSMQGSAMMYVTAAESTERLQTDGAVNSATISGTRSTSADLTITWSKPAVCARWSPALSVWFVKPTIGMSGQESTTSSGSIARDVADDEVGWVDAVRRHEVMAVEERLELAAEEEIDPCKQDRRHVSNLAQRPAAY